jgi:hypothetical protein
MFWIATELGRRLPRLRDDPLYEASIPYYISNVAYKFIIATARTSSTPLEDAAAFGFVTFYRAPMSNGKVLAVEAFWFKDESVDAQLPVWSHIAALARRMNFHGVCISRDSVNKPSSLEELVVHGEIDGDPILLDSVALWPEIEPKDEGRIYSAFADGPLPRNVFLAPCVRIYPQEFVDRFAGRPSECTVPFYRGEGRLANEAYWHCRDVEELASSFMEQGFPARGDGVFSGTVQEQILQQGYVNQPSVSLTDSFRVAAYYATSAGEREHGVVFTVDSRCLRERGDVFDAYATMVRHGEPLFEDNDFDTLRDVVAALDVPRAGALLERCDEEACRNAVRHGGLPRPPKVIDRMSYVGTEDWNRLARAGVSESALSSLIQAMENFWMTAVTPLGSASAVTIRSDGTVEEGPLRLGYYIAFRQVQGRLKAALESRNNYRYPGWDLTPFGYIAKTCRDQEFFSSGSIPGDCIVKATLINKVGDRVRVIASR